MSTEFVETSRQEVDKLHGEIVLKEPSLGPERDKFKTEAAYAFNRGISLLGINTLRRLKEWKRNGRATVRNFRTIDGAAIVYEAISKAPHHFRAVIVPNSAGVVSRITVEKTTGKGKRQEKEHFEIKLGDSPSYKQAAEYTGVNGEKVAEVWEYQYSDYAREVTGNYRRGFHLDQQQKGKPPFKFGQIAISYTEGGVNFLKAGDLQISFGNKLEPIKNAFLDLVRPHVLKSAADLVREAAGKSKPRAFSGVQVLCRTGTAETAIFKYDPQSGVFRASEKAKHTHQGDYIDIGPEKGELSIPAEIKNGENFVVRPAGAFIVEEVEKLSGSRTFVETRLRVPYSISADSKTENYIVPRKIIGE